MKKQKFVFATRFIINATLFQCKLQKNQNDVNKYLHLTLMKKLENIKLGNAAQSGNIKCLKYAYSIGHNCTLNNAEKSGSLDCIEYCKNNINL
jgi:hypothetical protein